MTEAVRSPGSTLKPLIYGLAFELGLAHPESLIEDRPTAFGGYVPVNFDGFNRGTVTIREALTESLNIPAVVVLDAVGPARLVARLKRADANPKLPDDTAPGLAVGLGGVGITLRDLVSVYAAIARGGTPVRSRRRRRPTLRRTPATPRRCSSRSPPGTSPTSSPTCRRRCNGSPGRIAYKTGTSYGYRDAWAIGFDGKTVIGVWVGRPDGTPVPGLSGIGAAAPILFESFDRLGDRTAPLPRRAARRALRLQRRTADAAPPLPPPRRQTGRARRRARDRLPGRWRRRRSRHRGRRPVAAHVKVRNGVPPFTFFANGAPFGRTAFARQNSWTPGRPGLRHAVGGRFPPAAPTRSPCSSIEATDARHPQTL